jgi:hypothetical protein
MNGSQVRFRQPEALASLAGYLRALFEFNDLAVVLVVQPAHLRGSKHDRDLNMKLGFECSNAKQMEASNVNAIDSGARIGTNLSEWDSLNFILVFEPRRAVVVHYEFSLPARLT